MPSNMNIVLRVRGGLGNQLFQYSYAFILSKKIANATITLDKREFADYYWPFLLERYRLASNTVISNDRSFRYDRHIRWYHFRRGVISRIFGKRAADFNKRGWRKGILLSETSCSIPSAIPATKDNNLFLYGYFQNASILLSHKQELVHLFTPKAVGKKANDYIKQIHPASVAVSIRLKDKKEGKSNRFSYDGSEYYLNAVEKIILHDPTVKQIVLACNDIDAIRAEDRLNNMPRPVIVLEGLDAVEQLYVLSKCKHFVCGNSTFSWWAAFLGSQEASLVFLPRFFYENTPIEQTKLLFPNVIFS